MSKEKQKYYFSPLHFQQQDLNIELVLPQVQQAETLYQAIKRDRKQLGKWLAWANHLHSASDEAKFIKQIQTRMSQQTMLVLTILVNGEPSGMIDLHKLVPNKKAEIGYWLASKYQSRGIVTKSVTTLCQYAFSELNLQYIDLLVAVSNDKSSNIAKRCGFKLMGIEPKLINDHDGQIFRLIRC
ncbi:GNAT family protein [uncultured Lactobacillus sp.]|uniref:GNAT family N-acetyltransferase n=1 Tax=uncultured Lactobacillus sp. TaxID=153152 RepID=UPI00262D2894|nr:GNAT family protein [uncultured Lactobacillus sp.]